MNRESAICFPCAGESLPGILHVGATGARRGVVLIVGGPQYRVGSHRQFVLLARQLSDRGIPVLRFDCRGMGDATGSITDFTAIDEDIRAAIDAFKLHWPALEETVLWGLCDAASAATFYAYQDDRVAGVVLLNPWVRTDAGEARTYLRHYYLRRMVNGAFWRKLFTGGFAWGASLRDLAGRLMRARSARANAVSVGDGMAALPLPERMAAGLERFEGPILCILSGNDLTAAEFRDTVAGSPRWRSVMEQDRVERVEMEKADHTFSRRQWRDEVARRTGDWVQGFECRT